MLNAFTLVLDGMPFIKRHLKILDKLSVPWKWVIVHGRARNTGSTAWCKDIASRLSTDGTTEYLESLKGHPNIVIIEKEDWEGGKDEMVNAALTQFDEEGVCLQIDSDEIWRTDQLEKIVQTFRDLPYLGSMQFKCEYMVGMDIVVRGENCYGSQWYEWMRAWRFTPGMRAIKHEPPEMPKTGLMMDREQTDQIGLKFIHFAYATRKSVEFKESYYGYAGAVEGWERLQANTVWPVKLKEFLPWVDDKVLADKI